MTNKTAWKYIALLLILITLAFGASTRTAPATDITPITINNQVVAGLPQPTAPEDSAGNETTRTEVNKIPAEKRFSSARRIPSLPTPNTPNTEVSPETQTSASPATTIAATETQTAPTESPAEKPTRSELKKSDSPITESDKPKREVPAQSIVQPAARIVQPPISPSRAEDSSASSAQPNPRTPQAKPSLAIEEKAIADTEDCTDSDNGIFTETKGAIFVDGDSYEDTCVSNNTAVKEYYCTSKKRKGYASTKIACPNGCNDGECKKDTVEVANGGDPAPRTGGTTIPSRSTTTVRPRPVPVTTTITSNIGDRTPPITQNSSDEIRLHNNTTCTDSDNGIFTKVSGKVTLASAGGSGSDLPDTCTLVDGKWHLTEYFCNQTGTGYQTLDKICDHGCENSKCIVPQKTRAEVPKVAQSIADNTNIFTIPELCSDTDNGVYSAQAGTVVAYNTMQRTPPPAIMQDTCTQSEDGSWSIREYFCNTPGGPATQEKVYMTDYKNIIIEYQGTPNKPYDIFATTDFKEWTLIGTINADAAGKFIFEDVDTALYQMRFYKATPYEGTSKLTYDSIQINCPYGCANNACKLPAPYCGGYAAALASRRSGAGLMSATKPPGLATTGFATLASASEGTAFTASTAQEQAAKEEKIREIRDQAMFGDETTARGVLEIWTTEGQGEEYFLNTGEKTYSLIVDGAQANLGVEERNVRVTGVKVESEGVDYIVVSEIKPQAIKLAGFTPTAEYTTGTKRIAIIITKPIGGQDPDYSKLTQVMQEVNRYYQETSYGKTTIAWDVFGPYEVDDATFIASESAANHGKQIMQAVDQYINYSNYWGAILADNRRIGTNPNATVGPKQFDTAEGKVNLAVVKLTASSFDDVLTSSKTGTVIHELGHNFGLYHASFWDCGGIVIDDDPKCSSVEYYDPFDVMGGGTKKGHFSTYHKEFLHWIDGKVHEVTADGEYTIYSLEQNANGPLAIKIPRKWDDAGNPTDFYYVEYRTATGFNAQSINEYYVNGPQIRLAEAATGLGGGSDTHLVSMNPLIYPDNPEIELNQTFEDTSGVTVKTTAVTPTYAKVRVHINRNSCVRRAPEITVSPDSVTLATNTNKAGNFYGETGMLDLTIKNNDSQGCNERYISTGNTIVYNGTKAIGRANYYGKKNLPYGAGGTPFITAQDNFFNNVEIPFSAPDEIDTAIRLKLFDEKGNEIWAKDISISRRFNVPMPNWAGQDMAVKFTYNANGDGKYILDKTGKIYRKGNTLFGADNTPNLIAYSSSATDITTINDTPGYNRGATVTFDSRGQIFYAGLSYMAKKTIEPTNGTPINMSCDITKAMEIQFTRSGYPVIWVMDEYGYFSTLGKTGYYPNSYKTWDCQSWDGRTDAVRETKHAVDMISTTDSSGAINGYYMLSKDGTVYACGAAPLQFTRLLPAPQFTGDREAAAFALKPGKGLIMVDNYGKTYASEGVYNFGGPNLNKPIARDIKFNPPYTTYGILDAEGNIYEYS